MEEDKKRVDHIPDLKIFKKTGFLVDTVSIVSIERFSAKLSEIFRFNFQIGSDSNFDTKNALVSGNSKKHTTLNLIWFKRKKTKETNIPISKLLIVVSSIFSGIIKKLLAREFIFKEEQNSILLSYK